MTDFILKPAFESDAKLLSAIHEECFPSYWNRQAFIDFFSVAGTFAYLASASSLEGEGGVGGDAHSDRARIIPLPNSSPQGGRELLAAMIVYRMAGEQADILTLAVRPAFRRQGIARRMMQSALDHLQKLGATCLFLDVEDGNIAAIKLYEGLGFIHHGRRKLYYRQLDGSYTDALVMTRKL